MKISEIEKLIQREVKPVVGCTEPASIAYAFSIAKKNLKAKLKDFKAEVFLSKDVYRNASTVFTPVVKKVGIKYAIASGILSGSDGFNPFKEIKDKKEKILKYANLKQIKITETKRRGIYVKALLKTPRESVSVLVEDRHDNVSEIRKNGKVIFKSKPAEMLRIKSPKQIYEIVKGEKAKLKKLVKGNMLKQAKNLKGHKFKSPGDAISFLIKERMEGADREIVTITGSGNQGIFIFVPFYFLYRKFGGRVLSPLLASVLMQIYLTQKNKRISSFCGLANKAALSLVFGMGYFFKKSPEEISKMIELTDEGLKGLKCEGAKLSCSLKGFICLKAVEKTIEVFNGKTYFWRT